MARWCNWVTMGVFDRCQIAEAAVRPNRVVVDPPEGQRLADMAKRDEQGLVQQLVAQPAVDGVDGPCT